MIVKWFGDPNNKITALQLNDAGIVHTRLQIGNIETAGMQTLNIDGKQFTVPVTKTGIAIEFKNNPSEDILIKIDRLVYPLMRDGGKDLLSSEIDVLKSQINTINTKLAIK